MCQGPDHSADDWFDSIFPRRIQEIYQSVKTVDIGQGKMGESRLFCLPAQDFRRTCAQHHRIKGMHVQVERNRVSFQLPVAGLRVEGCRCLGNREGTEEIHLKTSAPMKHLVAPPAPAMISFPNFCAGCRPGPF